jgi:RNA polymerase sigma-70 factor, ECF subfamily
LLTQARMDIKALAEAERELAEAMVLTQKGEAEACRRLLKGVEKMARAYVQRALTKVGIQPEGRAEDVVQEILLAVYSKRGTYDPEQLFLPWMYAIARYKLVDNLRTTKGKRQPVPLDALSQPIATYPETGTELDVEQLLASLPKKQRLLLGLVKIEGLTASEAAARTGFSVSDVKVSVHRALQSLKKRSGGSDEDR